MGKNTGFLEKSRKIVPYRDPLDRVKDFGEIFKFQVCRGASFLNQMSLYQDSVVYFGLNFRFLHFFPDFSRIFWIFSWNFDLIVAAPL